MSRRKRSQSAKKPDARWRGGMMRTYLFLKFLWRVLGLAPTRVGYPAAHFVGDIAFLFSRRSKGVVLDNLRRVLGTDDQRKLRPVAREVFRNLARSYFDVMRLPHVSPAEVERGLTIHGWDLFQEAFAWGKGVILATAHLGNFDLAAQLWAFRGYKVTVLVEPLLHDPRGRLMTHLRECHGLSFVPLGTPALKRVVRELRSGGVVIVACDRDIGGKGVRVKFLGEETNLPSGAVELALITGAAIIPVFSVRDGGRHFSLFFEPPVPMSGGERNGRQTAENLEKLLSVVGEYVRRYPEQWVLTEPVWSRSG